MAECKKICLISSSGGHYEQLLMLDRLKEDFSIFIVTEKTKYNMESNNHYFVQQINRQEKFFCLKFTVLFFQSLKIFLKENPDVIITTGALSVIPTLILGKIFNRKLIYIESFAKTNTPTKTGLFAYKIADRFIIQWEQLQSVYPKAIYLGSIY